MNRSRLVAAAIILLAGLSAFRNVQAIESIPWNYTDQEFWDAVEDWECNGQRQSPIDIDTSTLVTSGELIDLTLTNFDQAYDGTFMNTGHSVEFVPDAGPPVARFQNHRGTYELQQFHFHWGATSGEGSEHTVDGQAYSGELHFVTRKTAGNETAGDAFAVLGVLLANDSSLSTSTGLYMELLSNIPAEADGNMTVNGVRPTDLMPTNLSYYYYEGSLTTPACYERVQWFVLRTPVNVPSEFLEALRSTVEGEDGEILDMNFRMTQPLNGRQVMIQTDAEDRDGGASRLSGKWLLIFAAFIMFFSFYF